jgi:hypothetical protein
MDSTTIKVAVCVAALVSVSASFSLAHAQNTGLNGLDPNRTGRIAQVPIAHEGGPLPVERVFQFRSAEPPAPRPTGM